MRWQGCLLYQSFEIKIFNGWKLIIHEAFILLPTIAAIISTISPIFKTRVGWATVFLVFWAGVPCSQAPYWMMFLPLSALSRLWHRPPSFFNKEIPFFPSCGWKEVIYINISIYRTEWTGRMEESVELYVTISCENSINAFKQKANFNEYTWYLESVQWLITSEMTIFSYNTMNHETTY